MKNKITVVVCTRNEEKTIENCLKCLARQKEKPEIIIVDGHSSDRTRKIAKKYAGKILFDHGQGLSDARNVGWKAASSEIVAFCDADCRPEENWTMNILKNFNDPKILGVSGPLGSYDGSIIMKLNLGLWAGFFPVLCSFIGYNNVWGANMAFRKTALKRNPFRLKFLEDYDIGQRLRKVGKIRFDRNVRMSMSSRRFERGFYRVCFDFYVKTFVRMKLFGNYDSLGYYQEAK